VSHAPRRHDRQDLELRARLHQGETSCLCHVVNISAGGARLRLEPAAPRPSHDEVVLEIDRFGSFRAIVVWRAGEQLGIQFEVGAETMAEVVMGLAMYSGRQEG
jgi:hypothetical protein